MGTMIKKSDVRRLAGSLATLGLELEEKGEQAIWILEGWERGPAGDPMAATRGGGGGEVQAEDRRAEARDARRAGEQAEEFRRDLAELDRLVVKVNRRLDMACPPDMSALRNRRTGEFDPETATDMLAAGWCPQCFVNGLGSVPLSPLEGSSQVRRYADRCRPCGDFRKAEGIDKPKEIAQAHADGRRLSVDEVRKIVEREKAKLNPKKNKRKGKRKAA